MKDRDRVQELKRQLKRTKEQRDAIRSTRDIYKEKLRACEGSLALLRQEYLKLWYSHVYPDFDVAVPGPDLIAHVAHLDGVPLSSGIEYLRDGYLEIQQVKSLIAPHLAEPPASILDFGCGFGRLSRYLRLVGCQDTKISACDVDSEAIAWSRHNLSRSIEFFACDHEPPIPIDPSRRFDLIIVKSVFTHLPELMQDAWLKELVSRLTAHGVMLATVHGKYFERFIPEASRAKFHADGFVHTNTGRTPGLPDHYLTAFHDERYVRLHWSTFGNIADFVDGALGGQSAVLIRRPW